MILFFVFLFGLVIGSFLNVVIYRLPLNQSIAYPPSHCTSCQKGRAARDLIPVVSWLILRGKCRFCGERIHWRYPLTEFVNAVAWVWIIGQYGLTPQGIAGLFLFSLSLVITQIDLEHYLIPNSLVITCLAVGIVYHFVNQDVTLLNRLIGLAAGFGVPFFLAGLGKGGMGGGDIKLMAAAGFWLGFPGVLYALFAGALAGSVFGLILILSGRKKRKDPIPFGPFLVLGFLLVFFYQQELSQMYWKLF